jgi:hypothetical protein
VVVGGGGGGGGWGKGGEEKRGSEEARRKPIEDRKREEERNVSKPSTPQKSDTFSICACHPCAGAMLIFSVSFQFFLVETPEGVPKVQGTDFTQVVKQP